MNKRVKIQGGKPASAIDAGCASAVAFEVAADGVQLRNLGISGGTTTGLRVAGRSGVKLQDMGSLQEFPVRRAAPESISTRS